VIVTAAALHAGCPSGAGDSDPLGTTSGGVGAAVVGDGDGVSDGVAVGVGLGVGTGVSTACGVEL
jgi:hypothetical protein